MTVIRVGDEAPRHDTAGVWMDGQSAAEARLDVGIEDGAVPALHFIPPGRGHNAWPLAEIRQLRDQAGRDQIVLTLPSDPLARLILNDPEAIRLLEARCPKLNRPAPVQGRRRVAFWAVSALASVALIIFVLVPIMANQLARYLPPEGEVALGQTTFRQIREAIGPGGGSVGLCTEDAGRAALDAMTDRLTSADNLPYPLRVDVLDHDLVNAFALPGGQIVLFRGLIDAAESPDEVAAVLAHEIGHVVNRDPTRIALRSAGSIGVLGLLLGDFAGGTVVLLLTERLIQASYAQEAEAAADQFATETLAEANIPPGALADMFERLRAEYGDEPGIVRHFTAHPTLGDRIAEARAAGDVETRVPSLNDAEWDALQRICANTDE